MNDFQSLIEKTEENHVDYKDLCEALNKVKEVIQDINQKKRESEINLLLKKQIHRNESKTTISRYV